MVLEVLVTAAAVASTPVPLEAGDTARDQEEKASARAEATSEAVLVVLSGYTSEDALY